MDHEVHVIHQHPFSLVVSLDVGRPHARAFQPQFHFVGNRLDLPGIGPAAQEEIVGKRSRPFFHFQDAEFFGLFFEAGLDGGSDLFSEFVLLHLVGSCESLVFSRRGNSL